MYAHYYHYYSNTILLTSLYNLSSSSSKIPGSLEREVQGEAEEYTLCYILNRHKRKLYIRPEVYSALGKVLGVSVSEVLKGYERVKDGTWYRRVL
ncbi:hypothetical protein EON63_22400 [archaeon]|nr:MAG: hypothetical protein EON63_22400 [archaeon]